MDLRSQRYLDALAAVREVLDEVDPENLIASGAPEDEYDSEAGELVRLVLRERVTRDQVGAIWQRWFGLSREDLYGHWLTELTQRLQEVQARFARGR